VPITQLDISATQIRVLLAAGHRADFLTPPAVLAHIGRQGLYGILAKVTPEDPHAG
jgi:nicotinic acid mononucleotide adenylyltransferase